MQAQNEAPELTVLEFRRAVDIALAQDAIVPALRAMTKLALLLAGSSESSQALVQLAQIVGRFSEGLESSDILMANELLHSAKL
jgi:hypothetical protein